MAFADADAARLKALRENFDAWDEDGSGSISVDELAAALSAGTSMSREQARSLAMGVIAKYDKDGNNELDVRTRAPSLLTHAALTRAVLKPHERRCFHHASPFARAHAAGRVHCVLE